MEMRINATPTTQATFVDETVPSSSPVEITDDAEKLMDQAVCGFFLLSTCHTVTQAANHPIPVELQELIQQYDKLFSAPTELPPSRACDHRIPLVEGAKVVNQRPYGIPHHQKQILEKILQ